METAPLSDIVGRFPATFSQQRFWFQELAKPGDPELNIAVRWEIRGKFSGAQMEKAVQQIVERHEVLRTRFVVENGELWQEVVGTVGFRLGMVDLRAVAPEEHEARVAAMARELAARPFDLSQPCPLRITLVQLAPERAAILIAVHHIAFDGFSIGVLGHELGQIMQALAERRAPDLPELDLQYGDYALWEQALEASGALEEDGRFWEQRLKDAPYFELEPDLPRPPARATVGATLVTPFAEDFDARMVAFTKSAGISYFSLGAAALSVALHRWTGKSDILFAAPVAGRTDVEVEKLIGVFINTLVMRVAADPEMSLRDHVAQVGAQVTEALLHQGYPFDHLVRRLKPPRDPSRRPLVSLNLNMQRAFLQERRYGAFELVSIPSHMPGIFYDLNIQIVGRHSGWKLMLDYNTSLFRPETAEAFSALLIETFETILREPDRKLSDLPGRAVAVAAPVMAERVVERMSVAGNDAIRAQVQAIWAEILRRPAQECVGDFFDLGGHSLIALRMLARVQEAFGQELSLGAFLQDSTLESIVRALAEGAGASAEAPEAKLWERVNLRQAGAESPVVVTINQPFLYSAFARRMAEGVAVVNLRIADDLAIDSLRRMAFDTVAANAAALVRAQFGGRKMVLMGHCVDGLLALRMAQSAELAQEQVALVGMIDAWEPGAFVRRTARARFKARWTGRLRRWGFHARAKLQGRIGWTEFLSQTRVGQALMRKLGRIAPESGAERRAVEVNYALVQLSRQQPSQPFGGEVTLFRTDAHTDAARRECFGWTKLLAPDTPVFDLPGWHQDALKTTGVDRIARVIAARVLRERVRDG